MEKKISVIVPVYNVARYLAQSIQSILEQDYDNLEIWLIDDGSTDASGAICDAFAARDGRIQVIHQENRGAAGAKNTGLGLATGEYLSFVDSDDYLEPGAYRHMTTLLEQTGADAVQCAYREEFTDGSVERLQKSGRSSYTAQEYLALYLQDWTCGLMTDKLYRRTLFQGIFFEEGHRIDDEYFTYQGILNARRVVRDDRVVYHYRQRRSSVMQSRESARQILLDRVDVVTRRRSQVVRRMPQLRREYDLHFLDAMVYYSREPDATSETLRMIAQALKDYFREKGRTLPPRSLWLPLWRLYMEKAPLPEGRRPEPGPDNLFE